jgi:hypothetical protein
MLQGPVSKSLAAVIVDQNHEGNGHSSNDIEKDKTLGRLRYSLLRINLR